MTRIKLKTVFLIASVFALGFLAGRIRGAFPPSFADTERKRVFEIRTYTTEDGKLEALNARFRDHTVQLFKKHGMTSIGYWTPQDAPLSQNTLIYILAHPSREAAKKNWEDFRNDPEWIKVRTESEASGKIVRKLESVFADPTDYSPLN